MIPFTNTDIHMPLAGLDRSAPFCKQPARKLPDGTYARTTRRAVNVRAYAAIDDRRRGGSRAGLARLINEVVNTGAWGDSWGDSWTGHVFIQGLNVLVGSGYDPPGGGMQVSNSGRVVTLVAVSNGAVKVAGPGAANWTATIDGDSGTLNTTGLVFSAANQLLLFFADGSHKKYYDPSDNTVKDWTLTAGTFPEDSDGNFPRLIATWRGRTCMAGLFGDPLNIFMSKMQDPFDFDYNPATPTSTDAVKFNASLLGNVGDVVTSIIPLNDDLMLVAGDHTLWILRGDPLYGGKLDLVSDAIGMAWGAAWCRDPYGTLYFVSNRMGVYKFSPTDLTPHRISQAIEQELNGVNTGETTISLGWNDVEQALHMFLTTTSGPAADRHLTWEARTGSWWPDEFADNDYNPLCVCTFDGNQPEDRVMLIGSWDGYVRQFDPDSAVDDEATLTSEVWIGPFNSPNLDEMYLYSTQAVMGETSGDVTWGIHPGTTAEAALAAAARETGTWTAGRNMTDNLKVAAHGVYIKISSTTKWAMESIRLELTTRGKIRARGA